MKEKKHRNNTNDELVGNYETEQLIIAFTKITSLLRKWWGEAGANIITSNLKGTSEKDIIINPLITIMTAPIYVFVFGISLK